jgi:hypothetical protein
MLIRIQIGPNVSIAAGVRIGAGARVANSIILDQVEIKVPSTLCPVPFSLDLHECHQGDACVLNSIIGWNSVIGRWTRVEVGGSRAGLPLCCAHAFHREHSRLWRTCAQTQSAKGSPSWVCATRVSMFVWTLMRMLQERP